MAHKLQIQYDEMEEIRSKMQQYAADTLESIQLLKSCMDQLQNGGWEGYGAEAFFGEMESEVLPKLNTLQQGYEVAGTEIGKIITMFQDAEQVILSYFSSL
jgi:WXG100 family type VII secretion target